MTDEMKPDLTIVELETDSRLIVINNTIIIVIDSRLSKLDKYFEQAELLTRL
ncbi:hypothetical protein [Listeria seeligeri]|uniref:hypothetical protein n=1 Tax=Listeria seeligeri TaxID=1640 RepID=UPI001629CDC3|nr:hypothetical protein [Listeria seeligeri]EFS0529560.1 hypothetical protein [Listeria monocytogenes]EFU8668813.1 hypothetical protein [Listeria monocytogenes]MBC1815572.1 hypothetical protein [Listeria seeligeri]MBC1832265.1 hypothetical protein [Listeria seeligeri]MBC1851198.1 hypothetical protein [Listeria seeligeri]